MKLSKKTKSAPLLSWDLYVDSYHKLLSHSRKQQIVKELKLFKSKYKWDVDVLELVNSFDFEAVVVTNEKQRIQYASEGFKKLTGYPFKFTKGKSPQFLQGENTCFETRSRIRQHIQQERPFEEEVVNYRKDGGEYNCLIAVFPMRNLTEGRITHFVALEREVRKN